MMHTGKHGHLPIRRRGFTMVELLIGLAISAMLLAAVAAAFNASIVSYVENEQTFWAVNNARQALARMTSQLRTGHTVDPIADSNACSFFTAANEDITYQFRSADQKLYMRKNATGQEYVLCDDVVAASFTRTITGDGMDCKSVQISLTVRSGNTRRVLSAAAVIRRNLARRFLRVGVADNAGQRTMRVSFPRGDLSPGIPEIIPCNLLLFPCRRGILWPDFPVWAASSDG